MSLDLVTAPTVSPVSLSEAKAHLRISHSDDDVKVQMCIDSATGFVDGENGFLGRCLVTQTWLLTLDEFPEDEIKIPLPPLQRVTDISYDDPDGNSVALDPAAYYVDIASESAWVVPITTWPTTLEAVNAVRITFIAGYAPPEDAPTDLTANVPAQIKAAILLMVGSYFENRMDEFIENMEKFPFPFASHNLLRPYRVQIGMA